MIVHNYSKGDLISYDISNKCGFLLEEPLIKLPAYFQEWNKLAESLPDLLKEKKVREAVHKLPLLDHTLLNGHKQLRLAHLQLSLITTCYVWQDGDEGAPNVLPKSIAIPFYKISDELEIKPIFGHVDLLANWRLKDDSRPFDFENLDCLYQIPGEIGGQWFCIVTFMVEFVFAKCLHNVVAIEDFVTESENNLINENRRQEIREGVMLNLNGILAATKEMKHTLMRMHDHLTASAFFNYIRPFLGGWGGEGNALPEGLIYEGISDKPIEMAGGSAAQSASLQILDALLCVEHTADKRDFLKFMREFMPVGHRQFIYSLEESSSNLRNFVERNGDANLTDLYNSCISALVDFRSYHIQIVTKYIVIASKESNEGNYESLDTMGTGGTSLIPFLQDLRTDTENKALTSLTSTISSEFSASFSSVAGIILIAGLSLCIYKFVKKLKP